MPDIQTYQKIWDQVHLTYGTGHIVLERGLQCALYREFAKEFPDVHIVVEPWCNGVRPDLVIVENLVIRDIFELKYKPGYFAHYRGDIEKLSYYVGENWECCTSLDPNTGNSGIGHAPVLQVPNDCRLHFVVVSQPNSKALNSELIANLLEFPLYHWKGPSGEERNWEVSLVNGPQV